MIDLALPLLMTDKQALNHSCMHEVRMPVMGSHRQRGPPPPLPTTPKPKTAVTREITFQNHSPRPNLVHHGLLPNKPIDRTGNPPSRNRRICRRHTEKHQRKLPEVLNRPPREELQMEMPFLSATADPRSCMRDSPGTVFIRDSPVRRATRRVPGEVVTSSAKTIIPGINTHKSLHSYSEGGTAGRLKRRGKPLTKLFQRIMLA